MVSSTVGFTPVPTEVITYRRPLGSVVAVMLLLARYASMVAISFCSWALKSNSECLLQEIAQPDTTATRRTIRFILLFYSDQFHVKNQIRILRNPRRISSASISEHGWNVEG